MNAERFFATAAKGVEPILADELTALGALDAKTARGGVTFSGTLETAYRACLWSRTASRILLPLAEFAEVDLDGLYQGLTALPWEEHLAPDGTLAVDFTASGGDIHTQYGAQRVKDAVVDRLRAQCGQRPSVDREKPDLRINVYWQPTHSVVSLDLSGTSLHRRGYREEGVAAPLKENLAAALLLKAGWPVIAAQGGLLLDPLCGSGTLLIEGLWIAADHAPGLLREHWGFSGWQQHRPALWRRLLDEAEERRAAGLKNAPRAVGYDHDARAVRAALINAGRAGLQQLIHIERRELADASAPASAQPGLLITNPPYGERLGDDDALATLYPQLGDVLKARFLHWQAAVFTGNPDYGKRMGLRARKVNAFYNGALPCKLLSFSVEPEWFVDRDAAEARKVQKALAAGAEMFVNRIRKNEHNLTRWAKRENTDCYRLYDADLPEYAVAVDRYGDWLHVQEYAPPHSVDPERARERLEQVMTVLPMALNIPPAQIVLKVRERQTGSQQYQKLGDSQRFLEVHEGAARLWVNLTDYLDTGLFLDHRPTRLRVGELARNKRFLNLFAYTATASVHAALGGAITTTSVDMSATYLDWARRNLELNGIQGAAHRLIQADCLDWLERNRERYDLIFLDPPTFSNSKRMQDNFDVQRDHVNLIRKTAARLNPGGLLIFSTNFRRFKLDEAGLVGLSVTDITEKSIPKDFARNGRIHRCFEVRVDG